MKKQNKKELTEYEKQILKLQNEIIDVSKELFKIYCDREKKINY